MLSSGEIGNKFAAEKNRLKGIKYTETNREISMCEKSVCIVIQRALSNIK